jgi:hypothetical protein
LSEADRSDRRIPKALIAPHAGYVYSGPIAASIYARLRAARSRIRRVVLVGPAHWVPVLGLALPGAAGLATPLGVVPVDAEAVEAVSALPQIIESPAAHAREHSLEVQLPFLQTVLEEFSVVPFAVGNATPEAVSEVLDRLWDGGDTLIVVSSDLSHYLPYPRAQQADQATAAAIVALHEPLAPEQACGSTPINGLLRAVKRRRMAVELLDLRNSGDTAGDRARVVGYGAFAFYEEPGDRQPS